MHFTLDDIRQITDPAAFKRGETYFRQRKVIHTTLDPVHEQIIAEVQGNEPAPYEVFLFWEGQQLVSDCSCPVGYNCKHGVAAGLQWLNQAKAPDNAKAPGHAKVPDTAKTPEKVPGKSPLTQWLAELPAEIERHPGGSELQPGRHYLLYRLEYYRDRFVLALYKAYLKKDGSWGQQKPHYVSVYELTQYAPAFFLPEDIRILRLLPALASYNSNMLTLQGEDGHQALTHLLPSRRLMPAFGNQPLRQDEPRPLSWHWQASDDGQQLVARLEGLPQWQLLAVHPPCYLNREKGIIGDIITPLSGERIAHLCAMPPVPKEQMAITSAHLRRAFTPEQLPLEQEPELITADTPVPHLVLTVAQTPEGLPRPGAQLHFDYAGIVQRPCYFSEVPEQAQIHEHGGRQYLIKRNETAEHDYCDRLYDLGLWLNTRLDELWTPDTHDDAQVLREWQALLEQDFPELEKQGWRISQTPDYRFEIHDARFDIELQDGHNSWFDFSLGLQLGETRLDTMEVIGAWLQADMPSELLLPVGDDWLRVDTQPLWTIRDLLMELFDQKRLDQPVTLPGFQAAQLQGLELDVRQAPLTQAMMAQLQDFTGLQPVPVPVPAGLHAELRPYQQLGLNWLGFLHRYGFGGILADDMGLGKTLQALALIQHLKENDRLPQAAMILAPTSLVGNWQHEASRFTPDLRVLIIHGPQRHAAFDQIAEHDLVITTYPLLLRDSERYAQHHFGVLVLDEAQAIKNPTTKVAQRVRELKGGLRLCLSGTPLENHLGELWALMDFVLPGLLGGRSRFNRSYRQPIENDGNRQRQQELGQRLAPFMLRRTKGEVVKELPEKTEITQYVELQGKQRALYESIRISMEQRLRTLVAQKGMARSHIEFLDALLKLRQACIDPRLVKLEKAADVKEHAKLDWLADALPRLLEEGRHILVFSQFTEVLGLIETELKQQHIGYSKLTGQTRKRQQAIDRFQQGEVRVFLISLKAGGSGLNLTAADVVIHVDPWWNPAVENQATDRAHRIGQDKPVFVYKLVAADTVEERIQQMQQQKQALADALFSDAGAAGLPSDSDSLLALLG
ncbi:superfamily II DNA or RNA helicase [Oceanisphaera litoralis]|uniref:DEAD/DEAH box helicase n=1 Tax=Oceanisphaera litoralis TaxID=225144 RepID=UPI0019567E81|nr:DEAD/DEAH box helicase [Oceanisphaera litoralis]MBM7456338.1 superfamily II DNA or RNA helicase [Oceanisphaera litoralis]